MTDHFPWMSGGVPKRGSPFFRTSPRDIGTPAKGFRLFSCDCGLNRRAPKNETAAVFRIFLDGKPVWESPELDAEAAPCHAEIRLNGEGRLRLQVQDARRDARETRFFHPCFIAPELIR